MKRVLGLLEEALREGLLQSLCLKAVCCEGISNPLSEFSGEGVDGEGVLIAGLIITPLTVTPLTVSPRRRFSNGCPLQQALSLNHMDANGLERSQHHLPLAPLYTLT